MEIRNHLKQAFSLRRNLQSLLRPPQNQIPLLDGLRALAILLVFVCHLFFYAQMYIETAHEQFMELPFWSEWLLRGDLGVDVFFVISGFLIGGILFREYEELGKIRMKRFFARRFLRLMPVYWYALLSSAIVVYFMPPLRYNAIEVEKNISAIWMNLLYVNNFFSFEQVYAPMAHSWSLAVEEQFYFVCPLAILLFMRTSLRKHPIKVCLFALVSYVAIRWMVREQAVELFVSKCGLLESDLKQVTDFSLQITRNQQNLCLFGTEIDVVYDNLYSKFIALFAGVASAYISQFKKARLVSFFKNSFRANLLGFVALLLALGSFLDKHLLDSFYDVIVYRTFFYQVNLSLGLSFLILLGLYGESWFPRLLRAFLGMRLWYPIAQGSYSMYLFHVGFIGLSYQAVIELNPTASLLDLLAVGGFVAFPLTVIGSALCYLALEKPIMNLRHLFDRSTEQKST